MSEFLYTICAITDPFAKQRKRNAEFMCIKVQQKAFDKLTLAMEPMVFKLR